VEKNPDFEREKAEIIDCLWQGEMDSRKCFLLYRGSFSFLEHI